MAEKDKKGSSPKRITDTQRMKYIGFDVFPGKPKDLFKTDAEKQKYVDEVLAKREKGDILRDDCKLLEDRVTFKERLVLAITSLIVVAALFLPWYSAYTEVIEEPKLTEAETLAEFSQTADSAMLEMASMLTGSPAENQMTDSMQADTGASASSAEVSEVQEEIITGHVARKQVQRDYVSLSGIGSLVALGSVGSHVFSSGGVIIITSLLFIVYTLLCIALPGLTLYAVFGLKGTNDECALKLKSYLRYNWIPLVLFVVALVLSFFGANYDSDTVGIYTSIGDSYGVDVFLGTLSWGVFVSMAALILMAVKGIEI